MTLFDQPNRVYLRPEPIHIYNASLDRCQSDPTFLHKFYDSFVSASPRIGEKFQGVNFARQRRVLQATLYMVAVVASGDEFAQRYLLNVAEGHGKNGLDIDAELYDIWRDTLLGTVASVDPDYDVAIEDAWRDVLQMTIDFMLRHAG